jgi:hypothetical protein
MELVKGLRLLKLNNSKIFFYKNKCKIYIYLIVLDNIEK